jgi:hypothetical protein
MDGEARKLRGEVRRLGKARPGRRFPRVLKARLVSACGRLRAAGHSVDQIAEMLGISAESARRWSAGPKATALVAVRVTADDARATLTLVTPAGHRVEGLTVQSAAELVRALG